jgi:uncharacterized membrane protein
VGSSSKYAGTYGGTLGVRWDAGGTAATELGHLGLDEDGQAHAYPLAVNDAGTAVGHALKFVAGVGAGFHAVRWDAGTTAATELGHLGTNAAGQATAYAHAVDAAGNAIGSSRKYSAGVYLGDRAVRWEAGATTAAELDNLGTNASGRAFVEASAINAAGTAVGYAEKYVANVNRGERAVRWDAGGTAATELGTLGTLSGVTSAYANAINADGMIVGTVVDYDDNVFRGFRAVLWRADNTAFDLNRLIDPASGWTLNTAESISDTNFVAGLGRFDPDGSGPVRAYERMFVIDASAAIPEPATTGLISIIGSTLLTRWRKLPVPPRREEFCS